jgi:hypothetical protein
MAFHLMEINMEFSWKKNLTKAAISAFVAAFAAGFVVAADAL